MLARITEPPLFGLWTIRGANWRVTVATDAAATVALWVPRDGPNAGMCPFMVLPMLHGPVPVRRPVPRIELDPDLDLALPPFDERPIEPERRATLSRMTT